MDQRHRTVYVLHMNRTTGKGEKSNSCDRSAQCYKATVDHYRVHTPTAQRLCVPRAVQLFRLVILLYSCPDIMCGAPSGLPVDFTYLCGYACALLFTHGDAS